MLDTSQNLECKQHKFVHNMNSESKFLEKPAVLAFLVPVVEGEETIIGEQNLSM